MNNDKAERIFWTGMALFLMLAWVVAVVISPADAAVSAEAVPDGPPITETVEPTPEPTATPSGWIGQAGTFEMVRGSWVQLDCPSLIIANRVDDHRVDVGCAETTGE